MFRFSVLLAFIFAYLFGPSKAAPSPLRKKSVRRRVRAPVPTMTNGLAALDGNHLPLDENVVHQGYLSGSSTSDEDYGRRRLYRKKGRRRHKHGHKHVHKHGHQHHHNHDHDHDYEYRRITNCCCRCRHCRHGFVSESSSAPSSPFNTDTDTVSFTSGYDSDQRQPPVVVNPSPLPSVVEKPPPPTGGKTRGFITSDSDHGYSSGCNHN